MSIIHMQIGETRNLATKMLNCTDQMWTATSALNRSASSIACAWQSIGANIYIGNLHDRIQSIEVSIEQLEQLALILNVEIDEREQVDALGVTNIQAASSVSIGAAAAIFAGIGLEFGSLSASAFSFAEAGMKFAEGGLTISGSGGLSLNLTGAPLEPFSWKNWGADAIKGVVDETTKYAPQYSGGFFDWVTALPGEAGLLSNTDFYRISEITHSNTFQQHVGDLLELPGGVIQGALDGEQFGYALTSTIINSGVKTGLKYLIPGVGTAFAISGGVQLVGHLTAGVMAGLGYDTEAQLLSNVLETIDLDGYVDDFSDAITDWVQHPSLDAPPDFSEMGERLTKFSCGLDFEMNAEIDASLSVNVH